MRPTRGIAVDGSCLGNPGRGAWRGIDLETGWVLFQSKSYDDCTNNIAEFCGLVHAIAYCDQNGLYIPIYSDSQTARAWIHKQYCGTSHRTNNAELRNILERATNYVTTHAVPHIETWQTRDWGQIPSDFGFKGAR